MKYRAPEDREKGKERKRKPLYKHVEPKGSQFVMLVQRKPKRPVLKKNDQGLPGWNLYYDGALKKLALYPDAGTFYFEVE